MTRLLTLSWLANGKRITERRATDVSPERLVEIILSMNCAAYRVADVRAA